MSLQPYSSGTPNIFLFKNIYFKCYGTNPRRFNTIVALLAGVFNSLGELQAVFNSLGALQAVFNSLGALQAVFNSLGALQAGVFNCSTLIGAKALPCHKELPQVTKAN